MSVKAYSKVSPEFYDEAINKSFVYGEITRNFVSSIQFSGREQNVLDIGCGTGFVFEELQAKFPESLNSIMGIDPASGMLDLARDKFQDDGRIQFHLGSFEDTKAESKSIDKIVSTLALHWVDDIAVAAEEMSRILSDSGSIDILMIARDDGAKFKSGVLNALKKHLNFEQLMRTASLVQRYSPEKAKAVFEEKFKSHQVIVENPRSITPGLFEEHMGWWKARSISVISEVADQSQFFVDLKEELERISQSEQIPFDSSCLVIRLRPMSKN